MSIQYTVPGFEYTTSPYDFLTLNLVSYCFNETDWSWMAFRDGLRWSLELTVTGKILRKLSSEIGKMSRE